MSMQIKLLAPDKLLAPMSLVEEYLRRTVNHYFIPLFLVLFFIISISSLIKLATLTSIIAINANDFFYLYALSLSEVLFFALNASFGISMSLSLAKLSSEYELITLSSFGFSPFEILRIILPIALLVSVFSFLISLGVAPKVGQLKSNFINVKKQAASFNIKEGEYGQKFGKWMVYASSKNNNIYKDVVLLSNTEEQNTLILASSAFIINNGGILSLNLQKGRVIKTNKTLKQINFEVMVLSNTLSSSKNIDNLNDIVSYWKDKGGISSSLFLWNIALSFFPLISIFFYMSVGYFNPRDGANYSTFLSIMVVVVYVVLADGRFLTSSFNHLVALIFGWSLIGYLWFYFAKQRYY